MLHNELEQSAPLPARLATGESTTVTSAYPLTDFDDGEEDVRSLLSWVATWNRTLQAGERTARRRTLEPVNPDNEDNGKSNSEKEEDDDDISGILCACAGQASDFLIDKDILARNVGLAQGLVDFSQ